MRACNLFVAALVAAVFLLLAVRPAAAEVEQVAPITATSPLVYRWISSGAAYSASYEGHLQSCMLWAAVNKPLAAYAVLTSGTDASGTCTLYNSSDGWVGSVVFSRSSVCPIDYTWNSSTGQCENPNSCPVAEPPYTFNPSTSMCEREQLIADCPAALTEYSSGYYDVGTVPKMAANIACVNGCTILFGGTLSATSVVDGVKHYFAYGNYVYNGFHSENPPSNTCPPDKEVIAATVAAPTGTCAAGQNYGFVNGKMVCLDSSGIIVSSDSASAVSYAQTLADAARLATLQAAAAAVTAAGGSASAVEAAQSVAAGVYAANSGGSYGGVASDPVTSAFCADNPTASICVGEEYGTVEDTALGEKTVNVSITPVQVGGAGSCPAPTSLTFLGDGGQPHLFVWTTYCNYATGIKPILLVFAWLAAAGILVGGFKAA